jgi:uncharacterized iron-regulated protein
MPQRSSGGFRRGCRRAGGATRWPLPAALLAAQETEVRDSHCGMLPESMVSPMAKAQIARDVVMAETLRAHAANGVVLIAGNGHVRTDIGVPFWLRRDAWAAGVRFLEPGAGARARCDAAIPARAGPLRQFSRQAG